MRPTDRPAGRHACLHTNNTRGIAASPLHHYSLPLPLPLSVVGRRSSSVVVMPVDVDAPPSCILLALDALPRNKPPRCRPRCLCHGQQRIRSAACLCSYSTVCHRSLPLLRTTPSVFVSSSASPLHLDPRGQISRPPSVVRRRQGRRLSRRTSLRHVWLSALTRLAAPYR
ncbi:hypothetical protein BKA81DRAFT_366471 [Phyllosticta paracitricarpa]